MPDPTDTRARVAGALATKLADHIPGDILAALSDDLAETAIAAMEPPRTHYRCTVCSRGE